MTALPVLPAAAQRDLGRCGRCLISTEHRDLARPIKIEIAGDGLPDSSCNIRPTDAVPVDSSRGDELPVCRVATARWSLVSPFPNMPFCRRIQAPSALSVSSVVAGSID